MLTANQIRQYLPHRYPFLLIDRVLSYQLGESIHAVKNISINEPFFNGHFPHEPVMPGVLIVEAMAQAGGILAMKTIEAEGGDPEGLHLFAAIENARFKRSVVPGDQLHLNVSIAKRKRHIWKFVAEAMVDGELVCQAELTSAKR